MLNELLKLYHNCPVCGRALYFPLKKYWCPFCGTDLKGKQENTIQISLINRITARDEDGIPYYCGTHSLRQRTYSQDIEITAIDEVLEKLCQYEEIEEENNRIIDELNQIQEEINNGN